MQGFIVLGDTTSHGGRVISASPFTETDGKGIARIGDMVACPRCSGILPISQGDASASIDGAPAAYHGCKTACGATLIAGQWLTVTDPQGGGSAGAADFDDAKVPDKGFGVISPAMMAGYEDEAIDDTHRHFRGRFRVIDLGSGEPVAGRIVRVRSTGGKSLSSNTDAEGYTQWVERDVTEALAFDLTGAQP